MPYADYTVTMPVGTYILMLELVLAACVLLVAFALLRDADDDNWLVRRYVKIRLAGTRLRRMLARHHIGMAQYFAAVPLLEIKHQIHECRTCPRKQLCDTAVVTDHPKSLDDGYCPNLPQIKQFVRETPIYA